MTVALAQGDAIPARQILSEQLPAPPSLRKSQNCWRRGKIDRQSDPLSCRQSRGPSGARTNSQPIGALRFVRVHPTLYCPGAFAEPAGDFGAASPQAHQQNYVESMREPKLHGTPRNSSDLIPNLSLFRWAKSVHVPPDTSSLLPDPSSDLAFPLKAEALALSVHHIHPAKPRQSQPCAARHASLSERSRRRQTSVRYGPRAATLTL